jgi:hypothetical protein
MTRFEFIEWALGIPIGIWAVWVACREKKEDRDE